MTAPAFLVSAIASGQGKTTATAALARHHVRRGKRVRVFKTGADFLDALVLERAAGVARGSMKKKTKKVLKGQAKR